MKETQQYIANTETFQIPADWGTAVEALDPDRNLGARDHSRLFFAAWRTGLSPNAKGYLDVEEGIGEDFKLDMDLGREVAEIGNKRMLGASVWQEEQDRKRAAALRRQAQETIFPAEQQSPTRPIPTAEAREGFLYWLVEQKRFSREMFETPVKALPITGETNLATQEEKAPITVGTSINDTIEKTRAGEREAVAKEREEFLNQLEKIREQLK